MKKTYYNDAKGSSKNRQKILFVVIAVVFAVAMVASYLVPLFSAFRVAQSGDIALIGYTIRDVAGRPVISSDQQFVATELQKGNYVLLTSPLEIPVGMAISGANPAPVPILYPRLNGSPQFGLLGFEINAISAGITGMHPGETRTIRFDYGSNDLEMNLTAEEADGLGINVTDAQIGDRVPLGITKTPDISTNNTTEQSFVMRLGEIVGKQPDQLVLCYRYGSADIVLHGLTNG